MPPSRVSILAEGELTAVQRALLDSIRSGPRGGGTTIRGPFAVFLHAPAFGELARPTRDAGQLTYGSVLVDPFAAVADGRMKTRWSTKEAL